MRMQLAGEHGIRYGYIILTDDGKLDTKRIQRARETEREEIKIREKKKKRKSIRIKTKMERN